ncbi:MAG: class I SAM-dependent methyltransferase [Chloroflexota bacterium]
MTIESPGTAPRRAIAFETAYADGGVPTWEIGRPQGVVIRLADAGAFGPTGSAVLDAGCGTGHHAALLAARGYRVTGIDIVAEAIRRGRGRAVDDGVIVDLLVGDALRLEDLGITFDAALDVGLFHALSDADAERYVRSLAAVVRPGGAAFVVCWSDRNPFGYGPRRVSRRVLRHTFRRSTGWRVTSIEPELLETRLPQARVAAWLARLERLG